MRTIGPTIDRLISNLPEIIDKLMNHNCTSLGRQTINDLDNLKYWRDNQTEDAWIPDAWILAAKLPDEDCYGWSAPVLICQFVPGDLHPTLMRASYDFRCQQWRSPMGEIENVTHWQPLPDYPKEYYRA